MPETEYVNRTLIIQKLEQLYESMNAFSPSYYAGFQRALYEIKSFSKSDVAPVIHAKWIHDGQRVKGGVDWYHCSNCLAPESGVYVHRPYCSWCGANMSLE